MRSALLALLAASALYPQARKADWSLPFPPHKVVANVYYVGSTQLSSYLITTPEGHLLINSSFEETVPVIRAAIEKLGFRFQDVKILLGSHAHGDHMAGNGLVKELTGARVLVMQGDEEVVAKGTGGRPCKVDQVLKDGDQVKLGGTVLTAHHTPGHTKGCTTWGLTAIENGQAHRVLVYGSTNVNPGYILVNNRDYPGIADDYARSFRKLRQLACDIFLAAHPSVYRMEEKHQQLGKGGVNPFIDPDGYRAFVDAQEKRSLEELEKQKR